MGAWVRVRTSLFVVALAFVAVSGADGASSPPVITSISAGGGHTCALTSRGGVKCWGSNRYGQLGNGPARKCKTYRQCKEVYNRVPVDVVGLTTGVKAVAAGGGHTCALTIQGAVKCWGYNASGQLGNGAKIDCEDAGSCFKYVSSTPAAVVGLGSGVSAIAAGDFLSCALTSGGRVKCWGEGMCDFGGSNTSACSTPTDVAGLPSVVSAIGVGSATLCAVSGSGGVTCVPNLGSGVTAVALGFVGGRSRGDGGSDNGCALTMGGGVKCWGSNFGGQLGNGSKTQSASPVDVVGLSSGVKAIASGAYYSCAITAGGGVKCWGKNYFGTLGDGTTTDRTTPVDVAGLTSGVTAIAAGVYHACAVVRGGVKCWGSNVNGRLGVRATARTTTRPVDMPFSAQPATKPRTTTPGSPTSAGRCSKTEATAVVKRLHLGEADFIPKPVYAVSCGSFIGPGSETMVVSLASGGTSVPFAGWAVFRKSGGTWRLVMQRKDGAEISPAAGGIRETVQISRPGDSRCCPSGGSRARLWHWTGTRFTAGPWKRVTRATGRAAAPSAAGTPQSRLVGDFAGDVVFYNVDGSVRSTQFARLSVRSARPSKASASMMWNYSAVPRGAVPVCTHHLDLTRVVRSGAELGLAVSSTSGSCIPNARSYRIVSLDRQQVALRLTYSDGLTAAGQLRRTSSGATAVVSDRGGYFKTPSGNIVCYHSIGPKDMPRAFLGCGIKSGLKPLPPRRPCDEGGYAGDRVTLQATGRVQVPSCAGDPGALVGEGNARVLGYGTTWSGRGFRCTSAETGLTCRNTTGHGFFLSRERWRAF